MFDSDGRLVLGLHSGVLTNAMLLEPFRGALGTVALWFAQGRHDCVPMTAQRSSLRAKCVVELIAGSAPIQEGRKMWGRRDPGRLVLWTIAVAWPLFAVQPQMDFMAQPAFQVPTDCQVGKRDGSSPVRIAYTLANLLREELMAKK